MIINNIKIVKDTPFDTKGTILSIKNFRLKYNYICTKNTSDEDLIYWLKTYKSFPRLKQTIKYAIQEWFEVVTKEIIEEPLEFIYEGILYSKQFDGYYHKFIVGNELKPENSLGKELRIRDILEKAKFKKEILYCTSNNNKKLNG